MHYTTKVINIAGEAGEECDHLFVIESQTICGIELTNKQNILRYNLNESKLCSECKKINPIPRIRDWCPRYKIKNGDHAKSALSTLYLFYQALQEDLQIGWGIWEYGNNGYCLITNILINPDFRVESVKEKKRVLQVSFIGGEGRLKEELPFELIEEFMPLVREDYLEHLQQTSKN